LIAEGKMQPSGMAQVEAARADGRFEQAYAGSRDMVLPPEFLAALSAAPGSQTAFDKLSRAEIFTIYYKLKSAKKQETRARRIAEIVIQLQRRSDESLYG
jgi:uncharacterized protein YdeI (YjbR/CyaY-like superfamily)